MAAGATPTPETSDVTIRSVIAELQFILQLSIDDPQNPRLRGLLEDAKADLAAAAQKITGDDPIINT